MPRAQTLTVSAVLIVVRRGDEFLMVQETADKSPGGVWYLPAGGVEAGEDLVQAAHRELQEEAGATVRLRGLMRAEHILWRGPIGAPMARWRFVLTAEPTPDSGLKTVPDAESLGAGWFTMEQVARLPLRHPEVLELFAESLTATVLPMSAYTVGRRD